MHVSSTFFPHIHNFSDLNSEGNSNYRLRYTANYNIKNHEQLFYKPLAYRADFYYFSDEIVSSI